MFSTLQLENQSFQNVRQYIRFQNTFEFNDTNQKYGDWSERQKSLVTPAMNV